MFDSKYIYSVIPKVTIPDSKLGPPYMTMEKEALWSIMCM